MRKYSKIIATGGYLPERILTNKELESRMDTSDEWIVARTGIKQRHIAADNEYTSDLAYHATMDALNSSGIDIDSIDLIVMATTTPDQVFPSTACILQSKFNMTKHIPAFDVQAVCAGFVYALDIADRYIQTGGATRALVIGSETFSRIIDWNDRSTCILFGDGAGAVILDAADEPGIYSCHLHADGKLKDLLSVPSGVSKNYNAVQEQTAYTQMHGNEVFKHAVRRLGQCVDEVLAYNNMNYDDVDWLVPHQANLRIIKSMAERLKLPMDKVVQTIADHGNTSAASIPLALNHAVKNNQVKPGDKIIMEAFGGGFAWGGALVKM